VSNASADQRISVALCTYNGALFVAEQVASILGQSRPIDELVLSDDASTDGSVGLVRRLIDEHSAATGRSISLRVFENPVPLGVVGNFEQAITACTGDLIALCDQDDRWDPLKLETIVAEFSRHPDLLLVNSDARLVDAAGEPLGHTLFEALAVTPEEFALVRSGDGFEALLKRNLVTGATTVFRRSLLDFAAPFPSSWVHDEWLAILAAAFGRFDLLASPLIDYRQHGGNAIGASLISMGGRMARLREPRRERNERLLARAEALLARLTDADATQDLIEDAAAKVAHERIRSTLPAARIARLPVVLREFGRRGYARYGRGAQDALRDLVQPAR
jgi:glycosyltransferase involved in cell wall biosynthesis